jgi:hypothetical protein
MLTAILFLIFGAVILFLLYVVSMAGDTADEIERRDDEQ